MLSVERGKPVHCVEMVTGKNLTGTLVLSDERICAQIYSYDDFFQIDGELPIILRSETNDIVTLHSNLTTVPGTTFRSEPPRRTFRQDITSYLAVVGHDPWTAEDRIKRVTFRVKHSQKLMRHEAKMKAIGRSRFPDEEHLTIFTDRAEGLTLKAGYSATYGMEFDAPRDLWLVFEIEFDEPRRIEEYILHVWDYVGFLSFCLGTKLKPSEIRVDRLSTEEIKFAFQKNQTYFGDHAVHYIWPDAEVDAHDFWLGGAPVHSWDDNELSSLRACLVVWMNRATRWKKCYALMTTSFGLKNVISVERLINACRWFEDTPIAQSKDALSDDDIDAISDTATQKALELGYPPRICKRIKGAIKRIKAETAKERFTRLLGMIEMKFGTGILPKDAVEHLERATQFRGKIAHSHFTPKNDTEARAFLKSTLAMEALCYLLLALDLPIPEPGIKRIAANPSVRDYRLAYD